MEINARTCRNCATFAKTQPDLSSHACVNLRNRDFPTFGLTIHQSDLGDLTIKMLCLISRKKGLFLWTPVTRLQFDSRFAAELLVFCYELADPLESGTSLSLTTGFDS